MSQTPDKLNELKRELFGVWRTEYHASMSGTEAEQEEAAKWSKVVEEWYRRFEKNFLNAEFVSDSLGYIDAEEVKEKVLDAAKRAAGLLTNGKDGDASS